MFGGGSDIVAAAEKGHEFSKTLRSRSEPPFPRSLLWESFWDISSMRPPAFAGAAPVPMDKIQWYAETQLEFDKDDADAFVWIMRRTDSHFVGKMAERAAEQSKSK